jgi:hypothetical protein
MRDPETFKSACGPWRRGSASRLRPAIVALDLADHGAALVFA